MPCLPTSPVVSLHLINIFCIFWICSALPSVFLLLLLLLWLVGFCGVRNYDAKRLCHLLSVMLEGKVEKYYQEE